MLNTTLHKLHCPVCAGNLELAGTLSSDQVVEVSSGTIVCSRCGAHFPILSGVAILVDDVQGYLIEHVKGIARIVPDAAIPKPFLPDYLEAKAELAPEHIEEDLEAERVISLYFMNHYLSAKPGSGNTPWWKPSSGAPGSPLIETLIEQHWDHGPLAKITEWTGELSRESKLESIIELGCGVAGLCTSLHPFARFYLGVDSSFASIALGRHLALGAPYPSRIRVPGDLLDGPVSREIPFTPGKRFDGSADLIVGNMERVPVANEGFDLALALNAIDMLDQPESLASLQHDLLKTGGTAIQSCPYIWHEAIAEHLREILPEGIRDSASAAEWLFSSNGFEIVKKADHVPWLFFKHLRQLEIYSVHMLAGKKGPGNFLMLGASK